MTQTKTRQPKVKYKSPKTSRRVVKEQAAQYSFAPMVLIPTEHPHIARKQSNNEPIVRGKGVTVRGIVEMTYRLQQTPQHIVEEWDPVLSLAEVFDALSYYHDHKQEIDAIIKANDEALERVRLLTEELDKERKHKPHLLKRAKLNA
ncbi:MAG: hypothetical protein AAB571_09245 [Chloroflexota bacterium]